MDDGKASDTKEVYLDQRLSNQKDLLNPKLSHGPAVNLSNLCLNLVICPFCKMANWGDKQYLQHLKTFHSAQEIHSKILKKAVNVNNMTYKLTKILIPHIRPYYKNWPIPPKMTYTYKAYIPEKHGDDQCSAAPRSINLGPHTTLEPFEHKILHKENNKLPNIVNSGSLFKNPNSILNNPTILVESKKDPIDVKKDTNVPQQQKILKKEKDLNSIVTPLLPEMPKLIPIQKPCSLRLVRPWEDNLKRKIAKETILNLNMPLKKRRLMMYQLDSLYNAVSYTHLTLPTTPYV